MNLKKTTKTIRQKDTQYASFTRKAFAAFALSIACMPLFAQPGFDFGLRGIVQTTSLLNNTDLAAGKELNYSNQINYGAGIALGYSFTKNVGFEMDVLYSKQGQGYTGDSSQIDAKSANILSSEFAQLASINKIPFSGDYTARINLNYIKIPFLLRITSNNSNTLFFNSFFGPQIDKLYSSSILVNGQVATYSGYNLTTNQLYKKTTCDLVFGFGFGLNLGRWVVGLNLRVDYGLNDAEDKAVSWSTLSKNYYIYGPGRAETHNATGGGMLNFSYKIPQKPRQPIKYIVRPKTWR